MAEINRDIKDFGEHIGGAKKEMFAGRNVNLDDVSKFDDVDVKNFVNKNKIWKNPKWEELVNEGYDKTALYFIKSMKDSFPAKPQTFTVEDGMKYTEVLEKFRDRLMEVKTPQDVERFHYDDLVDVGVLDKNDSLYYKYKATYFSSNKLNKLLERSNRYDRLKEDAMSKEFLYTKEEIFRDSCYIVDMNSSKFRSMQQDGDAVQLGFYVDAGLIRYCYSDDLKLLEYAKENPFAVVVNNHKLATVCETREDAENFIDAFWKVMDEKTKEKEEQEENTKSTSNRKKKFTIKPLEMVEHHSPFGDVANIEGQNFLDDFDIRGGEFGNWLNDKDRQENMNAAHDAFKDLAIALGIDDKDVGLNNRLNIAFGARGSGSALAHYEPDREVINLTKMKGAGSLAHEFFHGIDNIIAKDNGIEKKTWQEQYATANARSEKYGICEKLPSFHKLFDAIHNAPLDDKELNHLMEKEAKELTDKMNKEIRSLALGWSKEPGNKDAFDKYLNYCQSLYEKSLKGEALRTFETKGRNSKWIVNSEIEKTLKNFHKELGKDANIERNVGYLIAQIENTALSIKNEKERIQKGESNLTKDTEFYKNAKEMDTIYTKMGHGYWQSDIELAARAFACYVEDKLAEKGIKNDYLCRPTSIKEGADLSIPYGEERKRINKAFDEVIQELKDKNILHQRDYTYEKVSSIRNDGVDYTIAIQNNNITLTNKETKEQETVSYSSKEEALKTYENTMNKSGIRYEINKNEGVLSNNLGDKDFIVIPNKELTQQIINQTEYYGSTDVAVSEVCLMYHPDDTLSVEYVKFAMKLEDGRLGEPFSPEADVFLPLSSAEKEMFQEYLSQEKELTAPSFDDEER